ncbi:MAG TPA: hypothetical protein VFU22_24475 [Roseiflexaceae bacterium]|nr:hypothetical protein [Roseiflexaceae bacterium]
MYYVHMISPRYCAETDGHVRTPSDEEGVGIIAASSMTLSKIGVDQVLLSLVPIRNMVWQGGR